MTLRFVYVFGPFVAVLMLVWVWLMWQNRKLDRQRDDEWWEGVSDQERRHWDEQPYE